MSTATIGLARFFLIDINDSKTKAGEKWVKVARQTGGSLSRSANKADTTHKDDAGFTSEVVVTKTWSASLEGQDTLQNIALRLLTAKHQSQNTTDMEVHVMLILETGEELVGFATLDSFETSFATNEAVTYSISLTGRGPLVSR